MGAFTKGLLLLTITVYMTEAFHLQHRPDVRRYVCMRAPQCCPGHVCRAYQQFDRSPPVAACARSLEGRPMYRPGSRAQTTFCGDRSRQSFGMQGRQPGPRGFPGGSGPRFRDRGFRGPFSETGPRSGRGSPTGMGPPSGIGSPGGLGPPSGLGSPGGLGPPSGLGPPGGLGPPSGLGSPAGMGPPSGMRLSPGVGSPPGIGPSSASWGQSRGFGWDSNNGNTFGWNGNGGNGNINRQAQPSGIQWGSQPDQVSNILPQQNTFGGQQGFGGPSQTNFVGQRGPEMRSQGLDMGSQGGQFAGPSPGFTGSVSGFSDPLQDFQGSLMGSGFTGQNFIPSQPSGIDSRMSFAGTEPMFFKGRQPTVSAVSSGVSSQGGPQQNQIDGNKQQQQFGTGPKAPNIQGSQSQQGQFSKLPTGSNGPFTQLSGASQGQLGQASQSQFARPQGRAGSAQGQPQGQFTQL